MTVQDSLPDSAPAILPIAASDTSSVQRALLLDLDGVLFDTRPVMKAAWRKVQQEHRIHVPFPEYESHLGREFGDILQRLGVNDIDVVRRTYEKESVAAGHLAHEFPGVGEMLHAFVAAGWLLGVVTSKPLGRATPLLASLDCPFAAVRTPSGAGRSKPAPDPILLAAVDLGVDPANVVYVGDMSVDQESAARAGVAYVHAGWGYGQPTMPTPRIVASPTELLSLLSTAASHVESSPV